MHFCRLVLGTVWKRSPNRFGMSVVFIIIETALRFMFVLFLSKVRHRFLCTAGCVTEIFVVFVFLCQIIGHSNARFIFELA